MRLANSPSFTLQRRFAARSQSEPGWPWGRVRQALLPDFRQLSEFTSVLATRLKGQENRGVLRAEGKLLHPRDSGGVRAPKRQKKTQFVRRGMREFSDKQKKEHKNY
jgi:hypothetical protein